MMLYVEIVVLMYR